MDDEDSLKSGFIEWLRQRGNADKTIKNYSITSINIADLIAAKITEWTSFYNQKSLPAIKQAANNLRQNQEWLEKNETGRNMYSAGLNLFVEYAEQIFGQQAAPRASIALPKPFLLLAGISGTGKTRFVRKQAEATAAGKTNYCHVAVRPDWHEPSDLLGYISRIGSEGSRYVATDVLRFIAQAWAESAEGTDADGKIELKDSEITPFWLCLDEMNLAPVEQYFADFLSVLETREWQNGEYTCDPLLKPETIAQLDDAGKAKLRADLGLEDDSLQFLWDSFVEHGIEIPPNLMVAGTVNMDETTHSFSRKVIDRAFTIDFGEFFPNDYDHFFEPETSPVTLTYSELTHVSRSDLQVAAADPDGSKSITFLKAVNAVLAKTPFELAYRALNELLLMVACFCPDTDEKLQAVWDDFLMAKVLPRIEGDNDKLETDDEGNSLLQRLTGTLQNLPENHFSDDIMRPDLLRKPMQGDEPVMTTYRSLKKLRWMQQRLDSQGFTAFWP